MRLLLVLLLAACSGRATADAPTTLAPPVADNQAEAVFAGGCFWCMEGPFDKVPGVLETWSGYTGGSERGATYKEVSYGRTSHLEALRVIYDPSKVKYVELLEIFWRNIDPTQDDGQFCDKGPHYRSAIFTSDVAEVAAAKASRQVVAEKLNKPVVTEIRPMSDFWLAEDYHQDFYQKNPAHYLRYRTGCGRDRRLEQLWGPASH